MTLQKSKAERDRRALRRAGIPAERQEVGWTPEQDALLGTDTDSAIAHRLGRTRMAVTLRRQRLQIPPYQQHVGDHKYASGAGSLGARTLNLDVRTAEKLDRCAFAMVADLDRRGIPVKQLHGWQVVSMLCDMYLEQTQSGEEQP